MHDRGLYRSWLFEEERRLFCNLGWLMASHTTTGEWKSFELRMRRRRAERLLLRAGTAADAGRLDEARDCIEEVRHLAPNLPGIAAVERKLSVPQPPSHVARRRLAALLIASGMVLAATLAWTVAAMRTTAPLPTALDLRGEASSVPIEADRVSAPVEAETVPAVTTTPAAPTPAATAEAPPQRDEADEPVPTAGPPEALPVVAAPPPVVPRRTPAAAVPASLEVPAAATLELPGAPDRIAEPPVTPSTAAPSTIAPPATPVSTVAPPRVDDTSAVRGVLDRYAAAYSDLDADAAHQVWPGVDRSTLARAFDGLASQRVTLGNCRINVTGETARATCSGSTTWAPKVGDTSPRTDRRNWSFDLARAAGDWRIRSARVQNR
jgi:hypothetical protein